MTTIPVYLVQQDTGQINEDGPIYITLEVKLTRLAADITAAKYQDATVIKMLANKMIDE